MQRASVVDGPGLRTAVFFKGCNLRCQWCHNPESQSRSKELLYFKNRCTHCGLCRTVCPEALNDCGSFECQCCGQCALACPHDAKQLCGYETDTDTLIEKLLRDKDYYLATGGGVTFTGGECLLQADALYDMLVKLGRKGIHRAVDTAGFAPWKVFEQILPEIDLFLYDLKAFTSSLHQALTGQGNELILDNYKRLIKTSPEKIYVRIPIIPFANDVGDEMAKLADFLRAYPPFKTELLPYHAMGVGKEKALGRHGNAFTCPSQERMKQLKDLFGI